MLDENCIEFPSHDLHSTHRYRFSSSISVALMAALKAMVLGCGSICLVNQLELIVANQKTIDNLVVWFQSTQLNKSLFKKRQSSPNCSTRRIATHKHIMSWMISRKNPHQISRSLCSSTVAIHSTYFYEGWWIFSPAFPETNSSTPENPQQRETIRIPLGS